MTRRLLAVATFAMCAAAAAVAAQSSDDGAGAARETVPMTSATLRALDTLNGKTEDLTLPIGGTAGFGHLEITLDACRAPREAPESEAVAFLRIRDVRDAAPRFSGWMFATSPALSALDHPRYDVWVLSCSNS